MNSIFHSIDGSVVAPQGFKASGVFCDIKSLGTGKGSDKGKKRDLAIIASETPATVAGMFTTNQVCAAPVKVSVPRATSGKAGAIVVNSGNANACTGDQGMKDALSMGAQTAALLGLDEDEVLICSTGRIGLNLPMDNVQMGIAAAAARLSSDERSAHHAAEAIMTSDKVSKEVAVEFKLGQKVIRIGGMCKGAGMIEPGMSPTGQRPASTALHATMLCFITTDAAISRSLLQKALKQAVALSFNRITVDGDMSTNDSVIVLANGQSGAASIKLASSKEFLKFQEALNHVCLDLARKIVVDGEGVTRRVTINMKGAVSHKEADVAARFVANGELVKTSWYGGDPNWGRIMGALGHSPSRIVEEKVDIGYFLPGSKKIFYALKQGRPTRTAFETLKKVTSAEEFEILINLNLGKGEAIIYTCDLSEEYVDFNKGE
ncbi:bifunctional glutamate N-acetyltransferase/amino-acid acetyltransferase ArgJ [Verrucomicrobia bacterium]|nr:bifunctional glutamate N-acetyltransferase/amino-acid acetyltransferase ArgJ [Verrucomicrobiota bacterium]